MAIPLASGPSTLAAGGEITLDVCLDGSAWLATLGRDVRHGLAARPRRLPPKYFYDETGSALFEQITRLPEYYLTRAERRLLQTSAAKLMREL